MSQISEETFTKMCDIIESLSQIIRQQQLIIDLLNVDDATAVAFAEKIAKVDDDMRNVGLKEEHDG